MTNKHLKVLSLAVLFAIPVGCGQAGISDDAPPTSYPSQWEDESETPYPDESWDPGPAPWEDCMEGYGESCEEMYGSGSADSEEESRCVHGTWNPDDNDGLGSCICDEGYASENCSSCAAGYIMTPDGCESE